MKTVYFAPPKSWDGTTPIYGRDFVKTYRRPKNTPYFEVSGEFTSKVKKGLRLSGKTRDPRKKVIFDSFQWFGLDGWEPFKRVKKKGAGT